MAIAGEARHGYQQPTSITGTGIEEGHGIHVPYQWLAENEVARLAYTSVTVDDIGKLMLQLDDLSIWMLQSESPVTWFQVGFDSSLYYTKVELDGGVLDTRYYTETELNTPGGGGQVDWANLLNIGSIDDLSDVDVTTIPPVLGNSLTYDGTSWVPGAGGGGGCEILDNIITDGTSVLLDGDGNVLYTPC